MKYYAGIGSRQTPSEVLSQMKHISVEFASNGYILRSGGAIGADMAFEFCLNDSQKEIFYATDPIPMWAQVFTEYFHPNPKRLDRYARKLISRNAMQILGRDGNTPVDFVVCWTKDGKASGGTGQAIRIANYFNIPVYNLYNEEYQIEAILNGGNLFIESVDTR